MTLPELTDKIIDIDLALTAVDVFSTTTLSTNEQFATTDIGTAFLGFKSTTVDISVGTAHLTLINIDDGSKIQRTIEIGVENYDGTSETLYYQLKDTEIVHAGRWVCQVTITDGFGKTLTGRKFRFGIVGHILDGSDAALIAFDDINVMAAAVTTIYDDLNVFLGAVQDEEESRVAVEALRVTAENLRVDAEALRETAESERAATFSANETTRQQTFLANEGVRDGVVADLVASETVSQMVAEKYEEIEIIYADDIVSVKQQLADKAKRNWANILDFGADRTGVLNCRQAIVDALAYAISNNIKTLYIPSGEYYFPATANGAINIPSYFTVRGDGISSVINFDDNPSTPLTWNAIPFRSIGTSKVTLRDFKIKGSLDKYPTAMQANALPLIQFDGCSKMFLDNVHLEGSRTLSTQLGNCKGITITNCSVTNSIRDGFRCVNCSDVLINNNNLMNIGDDAIAVSSVNAVTDHVNSNIIITNNIITMSQGIKASGGKNVIVSDNIFKLCHGTAISVCYLPTVSSGIEGKDIPMSLSINNNIIEDNLRLSGDGALIIDINGTVKSTDVNGKYPGFNTPPYDYTWLKSPNVTPPFDGVSVTNNKIIRTRPLVAKISDYGLGNIIIRDSTTPYNDPQITEAMFETYCIQFKNCISNIIVAHNIISGYNKFNPIIFSSEFTGISYENVLISKNIFRDNFSSQIMMVSPLKKVNFIIDGNTFDVDPYFRNPAHNADNTWNVALTGSLSNGIAGDVADVIVTNNIFKNCYQVFGSPKITANNYAYMQTGTPNKGVTNKATCTSIEINGDPTLANYMQVV